MRETSGHSRLDLFRLFVAGQHQLFDGLGGPKTKLTESFHRFWKIKVPAQRRLQQDGQRARYFDYAALRPLAGRLAHRSEERRHGAQERG